MFPHCQIKSSQQELIDDSSVPNTLLDAQGGHKELHLSLHFLPCSIYNRPGEQGCQAIMLQRTGVASYCCYKDHALSGLKQHKFILSPLWSWKPKMHFTGLKSRCWWGVSLLETLGKTVSLPSPVFCVCLHSLICGASSHIALTSASISTFALILSLLPPFTFCDYLGN